MHSSTRPSISLVPLVQDNDNHSTRKGYEIPRPAVVFSVLFFTALLLLAICIALFTPFTQAQRAAAAAASGSPS